AIDDRYGGMAREGLHGLMVVGAKDDGIHILAHNASEIRDRLARAHAGLTAAQENARPTQLRHRGWQADPRSQGGFFKDQAQNSAKQNGSLFTCQVSLLKT